jgi:peptide methionine sulfoxide reductase msrA/msrB
MKRILTIYILIINCLIVFSQEKKTMKYNKLTPEEEDVILHKATERPFTGEYLNNKLKGTYICRHCNAPLYRSEDKFDSHCGWPSFDDQIKGAVKKIPDADGVRTEIVCNNCGAHLGHVFVGERLTNKNTRYCVNSISMKFLPDAPKSVDKVYFASGCFWGTEYYFIKAHGVIGTTVGYMGGTKGHPTYQEVCTGTTGHVETVEVVYDMTQTSYKELLKLFFETHDFSQVDGQGPDIGSQYLSVIFYKNLAQKHQAEQLIAYLKNKGYRVATHLKPVSEFWKAEDYHQAYYMKKGGSPYCHIYRKIFSD